VIQKSGAAGAPTANASSYFSIRERAMRNPEEFWKEAAQGIDWMRRPAKIFDASAGVYGRWFEGGRLNACYNAVDRHVERGRGSQPAIIYDSPVTGAKRVISYNGLLAEVTLLAAVLHDLGVGKGDRVVIYMPMVPEAAFAMLACARLGAIHSVVFGGFSARELATRIADVKPKVVLAASCGIEGARVVPYKPLLDDALEMSEAKPGACVILQRPQAEAKLCKGRDHDWATLVDRARAAGKSVDCVAVDATAPLYVLYTSGTTGKPKGVVRDTGGYLVALNWSMKGLYGIRPGEVFWTASDVGWVVGHSYIVYAPLVYGATSVLYEGKPVGTPDAGAFWRVISEHGVKALFTAPTALRAIRKEDPEGKLIAKYDLKDFRTLFLAGERADPETIQWAEKVLKVPVIDHWWQTETGWAIAGNPVGLGQLPVKYGSTGVPMPGYDVQILDEAGKQVPAGTMGSVAIKLPLAPGCLPDLWRDELRFRSSYLEDFPGYYRTGDAGFIDADGYIFVMGRTDDIINVAGHRLSTGGMEEVIAMHPAVAECAVIGVKDAIKGEIPCGFIVLKSGVSQSPIDIEKEVVALVREKIGPVAAFKTVVTVGRLPKTRSGKILRGTMKKIADDETWTMPATIEDATVLDEVADALGKTRG